MIVYDASAGSGKTFTLAVQYIKLLITNTTQEYQHTLAVTFTNKATAEMKERILEQLYGISRGLKDSKDYVEVLLETDSEEWKALSTEEQERRQQELREKCAYALHEILHDYSRFRVETIDSFFQSVLRNLAHELGLSANMQIDLNDNQILSQAVDNMMDDLGRKDGDVLPWIDNYIKERIENGDRWDVRDDIKQFAKCIFREDYMRRDEDLRQKLTSGEHINNFRKELNKLCRQVVELAHQGAETLEKAIESSGISLSTDVNYGNEIVKLVAKGREFEQTLAAKQPKEDYFWGKNLEKITASPEALIKSKRLNAIPMGNAASLIQEIQDYHELMTKCMRQYFSAQLALKHLNPLRLLNHIDKEVTEITNEANRFILAKTPILLSRLIKGSDAPFVFEKMGTLFHNVMIDEFQDTSRLQWENFKVLMLENQAQGGHDLLVGDVKQSIYRWRNGDWKILANIDKELTRHNPEKLPLKTNFRSEYNIVQFNNAFFKTAAQLLDKNNKVEPGIFTTIYDGVEQECPKEKMEDKKGWVRNVIYPSTNKDWEQQMLDDLCEQVGMLHAKGIPYDQMCILQRDRNNVDKLITHFKEKMPEVALVSDEAFKLESSKAINIIINALKVLVDTGNDPVSVRLLMQRYLIDIMGVAASTEDYALKAPEEVLPVEGFLARKDDLVTYPLSQLCEELYRVLEVSRIKGEDSYLLSFYDELAAYLLTAPGDIVSFLEYWESDMKGKAIPACKVNGISIVTIHKSKGLQYHTVLMPYCNFSFEKYKKDDLLWCTPQHKPFDEMDVLPLHPGAKMQNSLFHNEMAEETLQKNIEELNALYVAFTRAKKNLLVWCTEDKAVTAGNIISRTLQDLDCCEKDTDDAYTCYQMGEPVFAGKKEEKKEKEKEDKEVNRLSPEPEPMTIAMCSHDRRQNFKQSTEGMLFLEELDEEVDQEMLRTADGLTYAQQGSLLHEIFSKIEREEQLEEVIQTYADNGVLTNDKQVNRIQRLMERALHNRRVKNWFNGTYQIQNECEIAFYNTEERKAEVLRPDRVMMNEEEIIVVDFKFGKPHPEEYHNQVRTYMKLLGKMYPEHRISGYLWYVYRNMIEDV